MAVSPPLFEDFLNQFIAFYRQGNFAGALDLIQTNRADFPESAAQFFAWESAMRSCLGQVDEAVQALELGEAQGHWYHEEALQYDPDFAALQANPRFTSLVERMAARRQEASARIQPNRKLTRPVGKGLFPLFLMMHGNNSNIPAAEPLFRSVVDHGCILAALQSSQPSWTSDIYVWTDVDRALAEVKAQSADLMATEPVDPRALIASGISMGGHIAVRMLLDPQIQLRGVLVHEAWFNEEAMTDLEQRVTAFAGPTSTRVVLIAGKENTEYADMARKLDAILSARGFVCRVMYSSNQHHGYPPEAEFAQWLKEGINWIMG